MPLGPSCKHVGLEPVPATVLDPFVGSGTTCVVAVEEGRDSIGIDLNPDYIAMAQARVERAQREREHGVEGAALVEAGQGVLWQGGEQ